MKPFAGAKVYNIETDKPHDIMEYDAKMLKKILTRVKRHGDII